MRPGDEIKVHVRVIEGNKSRIQVFQGVVIRRQGAGIRETFTIRKLSYGVGVERTFPVHTPVIEKFEMVREVIETVETAQEVEAVVEAPVEAVEAVEEVEAVRVIEKEPVAEAEPVADEAAPAPEQA